MSHRDVGEALVKDQGAARSTYFRQPDGRVAFSSPLDLTKSSGESLRYGIAAWDQVKGNLVGEAFVADKVEDVLRHPTNPLNLANNTTYRLTRQDRDDLKFMVRRGDQRPAYYWILRLHAQLFPEQTAQLPEPPAPPQRRARGNRP